MIWAIEWKLLWRINGTYRSKAVKLVKIFLNLITPNKRLPYQIPLHSSLRSTRLIVIYSKYQKWLWRNKNINKKKETRKWNLKRYSSKVYKKLKLLMKKNAQGNNLPKDLQLNLQFKIRIKFQLYFKEELMVSTLLSKQTRMRYLKKNVKKLKNQFV